MTTPTPKTIADLERELARVTAERDEARAAWRKTADDWASEYEKANRWQNERNEARAERDQLAAEKEKTKQDLLPFQTAKDCRERLMEIAAEKAALEKRVEELEAPLIRKRAADEARQAEREADRRAGIRRCIDCDAPVGECECN